MVGFKTRSEYEARLLLHRGFWGKMNEVTCFKFYSLCGSKTKAVYRKAFIVREFLKDFLNSEFLKDLSYSFNIPTTL